MSTAPGTPVIRRRCARVLLVDERDRLLLFHSSGYVAPGIDYYVTVGGGVEAGETLAEAAAREVFEETGFRARPGDLGPVVARSEGLWSTSRGEFFHNDAHYFHLRVPHFEVERDRLEPNEREELTSADWLTTEAVERIDHKVFGAPVSGLLKRLIAGSVPPVPVKLAWGAWCWDPSSGWTNGPAAYC